MKTILKKFVSVSVLILIVAASGCKKDYKTITRINSDGFCERAFIITGDTSGIFNSVLPMPFDSTWQITVKKDSTGRDSSFTAKKNFTSFKELSILYEKINNPNRLKVHLNIGKKFRWFYTYFYYTEKYDKFNLFDKIPLSKYLSDQEIKNYIAGKVNDKINEKIKEWEERNYLEFFIDLLAKDAARLNNPEFTPDMIIQKKNEVLELLKKSDMNNEKLVAGLEKLFNTKAVYALKDDIDKIVNKIMQNIERMNDADGSYSNSVMMPGLLISTNAAIVEGSKVKWEFTSDNFTVTGLEMKAESRVMNTWAVILSAVLVVLIIVLLLLPALRRRRS